MRTPRLVRSVLALVISLGAGSRALAQDRPFVFSVTTAADTSAPALRFDYDVGVGESAFQSNSENGPEQRFGVQATSGRLTLIGRFGLTSEGATSSSASWQQGEALYSLTTRRTSRLALAAGGGVRREVDGTSVLLARVIAGAGTARTRLEGNLLLEHATASGRDPLDVIFSAGWAAQVTRTLSVGAEAVGQDLEGFWNPAEVEGGARLLVGPSLHVAPAGRKWQLLAVGGPAFHPNGTSRTTSAVRDLPPTTVRVGYALETSVTYSFLGR